MENLLVVSLHNLSAVLSAYRSCSHALTKPPFFFFAPKPFQEFLLGRQLRKNSFPHWCLPAGACAEFSKDVPEPGMLSQGTQGPPRGPSTAPDKEHKPRSPDMRVAGRKWRKAVSTETGLWPDVWYRQGFGDRQKWILSPASLENTCTNQNKNCLWMTDCFQTNFHALSYSVNFYFQYFGKNEHI